MEPLEVCGSQVSALLGEPVECAHEVARYALTGRSGRPVACVSVEGIPVQNKTLISVVAIVALVAIGVAVLTLFIY